MADSVILGEALGLQTNLKLDNDKPFTKAIARGQELSFRQAQLDAKKAEHEARKREMLERAWKIPQPKVGKRFVDYSLKKNKEATYDLFNSENNYDAQLKMQDIIAHNQALQKISDDDERIKSAAVSGKLIRKDVADAVFKQSNEDLKKIDTSLEDYLTINTDDPEAPPSISYVGMDKIDIPKHVEDNIQHQLIGSKLTPTGYIEPKTNRVELSQSLDEKELVKLAADDAKDVIVRNNIITQNNEKAYQMKKEILAKNPNADMQTVKESIATALLFDKYKDKYHEKYTTHGVSSNQNGANASNSNIFNFDTTDYNQAEHILKKAGIVSGKNDINYQEGQGKFISISPTAAVSGNLTDEKGTSKFFDNVKLVYIPSENAYYASGNSKDEYGQRLDAIKITPTTIGSISSLLKTPANKLVETLNQRLKEAGINKTINLGSSSVFYNKKKNQNVSGGSEPKTKQAVSNKSGKTKITGF